MKTELDYDAVQFFIWLVKNYDLADPDLKLDNDKLQRFYRGYQQYAGDLPYGN